MSVIDKVEVTYGLIDGRVYSSTIVSCEQADVMRDDIVQALVEKLAEEVGQERAEEGTLRYYLSGQNETHAKFVLVAAPPV